METVLRNDGSGLLLFISHDDDHAPPWPDAPGFAGCADAFVEVRDLFGRPRCIGTLRLYTHDPYPSPAFVLHELAKDLERRQVLWLELCDAAEVCRIRIDAPREVWIDEGEQMSLTPEQEREISSAEAWGEGDRHNH